MKTVVYTLAPGIFLLFLVQCKTLYPCTICYVANDSIVLAGNNEDWKDPTTYIWFFPPQEEKHGWIKFGFGNGFPQGGMNDEGLFWDGTACAYLPMPVSEAEKEKYPGPLMEKVITTCCDINEAREEFGAFYCDDQYRAQYLIGDAHGKSMIVEGDNILSGEEDYQILTNFYHSYPDLGGYPCWRYEMANSMLSSTYKLTPYFIGSILDVTHQEGNYPTQYSTIYDLKNSLIYLFYYHNFEEFIIIDLNEELKKGYRSVEIPGLFSRIRLLSPSDGEHLESTSVTYTWEGKHDHGYEVIYSTDSTFTDIKSVIFSNKTIGGTHHPYFIYYLSGLLLLIPWIKRKKIVYPSVFLLMLVFCFSHCRKEEANASEEQLALMTETISDLLPDTTYYWKIKAHKTGQDDFYSETLTRYFETGK